MKEIANGWTDASYATLCQFEHYPLKEAKQAQECKPLLYIVETINWTLADKKTVHRNRYYTYGLPEAIGLAAQIEIASVEIAEEVIVIRPAEEAEEMEFLRVSDIRDKVPGPDLTRIVSEGEPPSSRHRPRRRVALAKPLACKAGDFSLPRHHP
jgi:hypothetical protein